MIDLDLKLPYLADTVAKSLSDRVHYVSVLDRNTHEHSMRFLDSKGMNFKIFAR